ncbi:MFS transporter [Sinirhodobacter populi]|uniref:Putative tartrate transporter n=1 Tax=Paenirhodobacter populi TaxID=2306993 RepID=A0A443K9C2_9RHOB|nr:MFS transporter [Sinirhodobacter populi]RWR29302.1 MFS transporter [Sinirhodobacter populi]
MSDALEKRVMRKISWRIIPFIMLLYFIAFLDRVNVGFAAIHMNEDVGLSPSIFGFGAGLFFIGYFLFEVPSNLALEKFGARLWIARVMITWGLISGAMAFVQGPTSFYILRFLLGAAEAGFFPGIILYLSYWFPAKSRAQVTALFMAAAPISVALGSPISGLLLEMDGLAGWHGWQWMFVLEAIPALILGVVVLFYMTDRPEKAKWLDAEEREWLSGTINAERAAKEHAGASHSILKGLTDPRVLALSLVYFGTSAGLYTLGIWAPQMLHGMGLTSLQTGLVNAIPPILAVIAMYVWSRHSDRTGERTWHVTLACLAAGVGLFFAGFAVSLVAVVLALVLVNAGVSAAKPPLWSMPTMFLSGSAAATGIATINSLGNLGGFVGPYVIGLIKQATGSFEWGLYFVASLLVLSAIVTLIIAGAARKNASSQSSTAIQKG